MKTSKQFIEVNQSSSPPQARTRSQYKLCGKTALAMLVVLSIAMVGQVQAQTLKRALFYGPASSLNGLAEQFVNNPANGVFEPIGTGATDSQVWTESEWITKTTADFAAFDIIVFGDQPWGGPTGFPDQARWNTAIANRAVWSAAVNGNALVFGGDPDNSGHLGNPLVEAAMVFGANQAGYVQHVTGLYVALGHASFGSLGGGVRIPGPVDLLGGIGSFMAVDAVALAGGCADNSIKVASHPVLDCLSNGDLANWQCSAHQGFHSWPSTFIPLAIVAGTDAPTPGYTPPCNNSYADCGNPALVYILARGNFKQLTATPCVEASGPGQHQTITAQFKTNPGGIPIPGRRIGFTIAGANAGAEGDFDPANQLTDQYGAVSFTYQGDNAGQDIITLFVDDNANDVRDACEAETTAICNWGGTIARVTASDPNAAEPADPGKFRFTRTGSTANPLDVYFCVTGTADQSTDYDLSATGGTVRIEAGYYFADVTVTPIDDAFVEGPETVVVTMQDDPSVAYVVGSPFQATVTIYDDETPSIVTLASSGSASEAGQTPATVTFNRTGNTAQGLTVFFELPAATGAALLGADYSVEPVVAGEVTFQPTETSVSMTLTPFQDSRNEGNEVATVTLLAHPSYQLGTPSTLGVSIQDNDNVSLPPSYNITALGPANKNSHAFAINTSRVVAGDYKLSIKGWRGFSWNNGTLTTIGIPNGDPGCTLSSSSGCGSSYAFGINDSGVVVGYGYGGGDFEWPYRWTSGMPEALGVLDLAQSVGSRATAINNDGHSVGFSRNSSGKTHAVLWFAGTTAAADWGTLAGFDDNKDSFATGINSAGRVVGKSMIVANNTTFHAFRTQPLQSINPPDDLGNLVGGETLNSEANWINDLEEVVGATTVANGQSRAFWKDGNSPKNQGFIDLGVLAGDNQSVALGLNDTGHAVGYSLNTTTGNQRAVVCFNNGVMWDWNAHLVGGSGWVLKSAEAINSDGSIVGWGIKGGLQRGFLLVPNN